MAIWFHSEDTPFELREKNRHRRWLKAVAGEQSIAIRSLNIVFTSDTQITQINSTYLNHHHPTDVISFDYSDGRRLSGDIYIGVQQVSHNARFFGSILEEEIRRVMVHGLLHLMGMDDRTPEESEGMRKKENEALTLWHKI